MLTQHLLEERTAAVIACEEREELLLLDAEVARRLGEEGRDVQLRCRDSRLGDVGAGGEA